MAIQHCQRLSQQHGFYFDNKNKSRQQARQNYEPIQEFSFFFKTLYFVFKTFVFCL